MGTEVGWGAASMPMHRAALVLSLATVMRSWPNLAQPTLTPIPITVIDRGAARAHPGPVES